MTTKPTGCAPAPTATRGTSEPPTLKTMISKLAAAVLITALTPLLPAQSEEALLATLKNQTGSLEQKQNACQRLAAIGTADAVPTLAGMLSDPALAHSARYALETIPGPAADTALREALPTLNGAQPVSYTHLTLPTRCHRCRSRWSAYHD